MFQQTASSVNLKLVNIIPDLPGENIYTQHYPLFISLTHSSCSFFYSFFAHYFLVYVLRPSFSRKAYGFSCVVFLFVQKEKFLYLSGGKSLPYFYIRFYFFSFIFPFQKHILIGSEMRYMYFGGY